MEKIGIIGLGRLGLCFALNIEKIGYEVLGVEKNEMLVKNITSKTLQSNEPEVETMLGQAENLIVSCDFQILNGVRNIFCFVATPSGENGAFSHDQVDEVLNATIQVSNGNPVNFIVCCTTMPGYCEQLQRRVVNYNISIIYNPEFIAQGSIIRDQLYPDQILIGKSPSASVDFLISMYQKMVKSNPSYLILSPTEAEISKLATNCFLTMKIAFANALGDACLSWGANPQEVLNAIGSDSRIGNKYLKYGFGFGGPCFPRDNKALIFASEQIGIDFIYSKTTIGANDKHFEFQLQELLLQKKDAYHFDSLAYKNDSDIIEESQRLRLALALIDNGKKVIVNKDDKSRQNIEKLYSNIFTFE